MVRFVFLLAGDSFIFVISSPETTGQRDSPGAVGRGMSHLEQNVATVVNQITQLAVLPFVEFARELRCCGNRGLCF